MIRREAKKRPQTVEIAVSDKSVRHFNCYDWGEDSFVIEKGVLKAEDDVRSPVTVAAKSLFVRGSGGFIMTVTTGNHAVGISPLLGGKFWNFGEIPKARRSELVRTEIVCANIVGRNIEISQRDADLENIVRADEWFRRLGFGLDRIVFAERTQDTIDYYRKLGQEWRIKPLAWTMRDMKNMLEASRRRITNQVYYYYNVRGVHFLTYQEFLRVVDLSISDYPVALQILRSWVGITEHGGHISYMRMAKYHEHHEIECFGLPVGYAMNMIVPRLEKLAEDVMLKRVQKDGAISALSEIASSFRKALVDSDLTDESSPAFVESMYKHLTGNVYQSAGNTVSAAFDDHRTALPGVSFYGGRPEFHPGADQRTRDIVARVQQWASYNERLEHLNIYEIRTRENTAPGSGITREIILKTNRHAYTVNMIEKQLAGTLAGYADYMLTRANVFRELGANFCAYTLVTPQQEEHVKGRQYFIRPRCPGYPLEFIPASYFNLPSVRGQEEEREDRDVVLRIAELLGEVAAQNMAARKYLAEKKGSQFGVGKEIFEFAYNVQEKKVLPTKVKVCSIRGVMGWPDFSQTEKNERRMNRFYIGEFAGVCGAFWKKHADCVSCDEVADVFFDGFENKTHEMFWRYQMKSEDFDSFEPNLKSVFNFRKRWAFVLWALERQNNNLSALRRLFMEKVKPV